MKKLLLSLGFLFTFYFVQSQWIGDSRQKIEQLNKDNYCFSNNDILAYSLSDSTLRGYQFNQFNTCNFVGFGVTDTVKIIRTIVCNYDMIHINDHWEGQEMILLCKYLEQCDTYSIMFMTRDRYIDMFYEAR